MKRIFIMLTIATLLLGCRKNKENSIDYTIFALNNGIEWKAGSLFLITKPDTLFIGANTYDQKGLVNGDLAFYNILLIKGKQLLSDGISNRSRSWVAYHTVIGGDVSGGYYKPYPEEDNFIEIQQIEPCRKYIKGIFRVTFILDPASKQIYPYLPDTVRFTNGTFASYYKEDIK